jgi:hypothetical protein
MDQFAIFEILFPRCMACVSAFVNRLINNWNISLARVGHIFPL